MDSRWRHKAAAGRPRVRSVLGWAVLWQVVSWWAAGGGVGRAVGHARQAVRGEHGGLTTRAGGWWRRRECGQAGWRQWPVVGEGQLRLEQAERLAFGTVVQAVMADLAEADRQHVQQEAADELVGGEAQGAGPAGVGVTVANDDLAVVILQDGGVGQRHAEDVAGEVAEGVLAGANGLGVNHPRLPPDGCRDRGEECGLALAQEVAHACGEEDGHSANTHPPLSHSSVQPLPQHLPPLARGRLARRA